MDIIKIDVNGAVIDIPKEQFSQAVEKGELKISNEGLVVKTKTDFDSFIENTTKERYQAGIETAEKRAVNLASEKFGVKLDDSKKTIENFANAYAEKLKSDLKIEPDKKLKEYQEKEEWYKTKLNEWEGKYNDLNNQFSGFQTKNKVNSLIDASFPRNEKGEKVKTLIHENDLKTLFLSRASIEFDENGKEIITIDGKKQINENNRNNLSMNEVFSEFIKPYIKQAEGGSGENGDRTGGGQPGTLEAFDKEMKEKNISGIEYNKEMSKRINNGTLKLK